MLLIILLGFPVLRPSMSGLLQSATSVITKNYRFFFYYKVRQVLQSGTIITKCDRTDLHCVLILFHEGRIWLQIYFTKLHMNIKGNKTKFIDFYLRFRIGTLFHTSNVILQGLYCVTITEHELPVMSHEKYIKPTNYRTNKQKRIKYKPKPTEQLYIKRP